MRRISIVKIWFIYVIYSSLSRYYDSDTQSFSYAFSCFVLHVSPNSSETEKIFDEMENEHFLGKSESDGVYFCCTCNFTKPNLDPTVAYLKTIRRCDDYVTVRICDGFLDWNIIHNTYGNQTNFSFDSTII